ncbi:MAG TPA: glycosyltransferase [Thermoanaerobaculia bacterium]|nr:glycosyltransferase [Thermoanaerobaculia bacterium]
MAEVWACTIAAKNYLPFARVLARSFREHHPQGRFFVGLVDEIEEQFDPAAEPFEMIEARDLGIQDFAAFAFRYTILELSTAIKPALLRHLLALGASKLLYFDPDILVASPLEEVRDLLDDGNVVLTPHLDQPIEDDRHPGELAILQSGAYNLGFIGLAASEETLRLLDWWHRRVYELCVVDIARGLFVDQKWIDLVPGLFQGVRVLAHPGHNVAYWNLHGRRVERARDGGFTVNGLPLRFFHFSGFDPQSPGAVSKHQNRFTLGDLGDARALYHDYRDRLFAAGYREARSWPYAYGRFANGVRIPDAARVCYRGQGSSARRRFGDPFATGEGSFYRWMLEPVRADVPAGPSRLLYTVYTSRPDLVESYPDVFDADVERFRDWVLGGGAWELGFDDALLPRRAPAAPVEPVTPAVTVAAPRAGLGTRLRASARRAYHSSLSRRFKGGLRRALGERRTAAIKDRIRPRRAADAAPAGALVERLGQLVLGEPGVNVWGYLTAESGMGEAGRLLARAIERAGVPLALGNLELGVASRTTNRTFQRFSSSFEHGVNVFVVNADQVPHIAAHLGGEKWRRRYNVGFWFWELQEFPRKYFSSFEYFHEVWTGSTFAADALAAVSPVPVRRMPLAVDFSAPTGDEVAVLRRRLGLDAEPAPFTFLFVFDYLSQAERKNPLGVVEAFRRAFGPGDHARLVLKTINRELFPEHAARLESAAAGLPVLFLDEYLTQHEVHTLMAACDAYVSLHRSEGFGLTLAEAMALGKPLIATDYGGSADFTTVGGSFPVPYRLVEIAENDGPYPAGALWAEPDLDAAAEAMRRVANDPLVAGLVAAVGQREVRERFSLDAMAARVRAQVARIEELVASARRGR